MKQGKCCKQFIQMNTVRMAVQVSNKTSRASQLQVSSSVLLVMRTLITSDINIDKKVRVPIGLKYQNKMFTLVSLFQLSLWSTPRNYAKP